MTGLDWNTEFEALAFGFHHASEDAIWNRTEVLVFELLTFRRLSTEERTATGIEVRAEIE